MSLLARTRDCAEPPERQTGRGAIRNCGSIAKKLGPAVRDLSFPGSIAGAANGRSDGRASEIPFQRSTSIRDLEGLRGYVRHRAQREPLVLVWEDLHWCDPSSWEVFEMLVPLSNEVPLLVLCAARLEDNRLLEVLQQNDGNGVRHVIRLSPLTRDES